MSNKVWVGLKGETNFEVKGNTIVKKYTEPGRYQIYANCDEVSIWIGSCENINDLELYVSEEELIDSIEQSASEYEYDAIMAALRCSDYKYDFFGKIRIAEGED